MLTIAGGIILAVVLIVTAPLWIGISLWLLGIALILGAVFLVIGLISNNPQEFSSLVIGVIAIFFFFTIFKLISGGWKRREIISQMISEWWKRKIKKKIFQKPLNESTDSEDNTNETGEEKNSILEKIDQVREKEITRLQDEKKKAEEAKRKENELLAERFITIKTALQELKHTYTEHEGIKVEISEFPARLTLGFGYSKREIVIGPNQNDEGYYINDDSNDNYDDRRRQFDYSEEVIDYVVEQVGKFLAEWESR